MVIDEWVFVIPMRDPDTWREQHGWSREAAMQASDAADYLYDFDGHTPHRDGGVPRGTF